MQPLGPGGVLLSKGTGRMASAGGKGETMIKNGIGIAAGVALVSLAATMQGPASMASQGRAGGATRPAARAAAAGSAPVAWVVNQSVRSPNIGSVTPLNTATNRVIRKIPVSRNAIAVALTPDGTRAYVALNAVHPGGRGLVVPVSTSTYRVGKPIKIPTILPATMLITPDGKTVYVGDWDSGTVTPIHTATNTAGRPITTGPFPFAVAMAITPNGQTLYAVNEGPGTVTPIHTATNTAGKNIKVGETPGPIVIAPDGKTAYVLNLARGAPGKGTVTPINTATNTKGKPIKAGTFPDALNLLVITPNGKTLYAVGNTAVTPIDTATNTPRRAIRVAPRHGFDAVAAMTPDGRTVYIGGLFGGQSRNGFIVPVRTATGAVGKAIITHGFPTVLAITPNGKTLYALCTGEPQLGVPQDVVPVNTTTNTAGKAIGTGLQPTAIAIEGSLSSQAEQAVQDGWLGARHIH